MSQAKNRKFDRNRKRSPAMSAYKAESRQDKNKRIRIEREAARQGKTVAAYTAQCGESIDYTERS